MPARGRVLADSCAEHTSPAASLPGLAYAPLGQQRVFGTRGVLAARYGAPAPPVGLELASLSFVFSGAFSSLPVPPEAPPVPSELSLAGASALDSDSGSSPVVPVGLVPVLPFVEVVDVEVVCAAAFSALVSLGGMMSGVDLGTASETLLPPHALRPNAPSTPATAASAMRVRSSFTLSSLEEVRPAPCACRRWGSR